MRRTRMQFNRIKDFQTPSDEESVKSVHGRRGKDWENGWIL